MQSAPRRALRRLLRLPCWLAAAGIGFPAAQAAGATALSANDFLNSIGVCVHVQHGQDASKMVAPLQYLGVRNVRDGADRNYDMSGLLTLHQQAAVLVAFGPGSGPSDRFVVRRDGAANNALTATIAAARQLAEAGALLAVEGPNEPNNFGGVTYQGHRSGVTNGTWLPVAEFQRDLYRAVKSDAVLKNYPVFGSSEMGAEIDDVGLQYLTIPAGANCLMPDGTPYADFANVHNYVCGHWKGLADNQPFQAATHTNVPGIDGLFGNHGNTWRKHFPGYAASRLATLPKVTTETGWRTDNTISGDDIQGKVFLNVFLDQYQAGWKHTFIYELMDDPDGAFGFYKSDYATGRKSADYLHNLTAILADTNSLAAPGQLDYSIPDQPATVHDMLLQKSNGAFELAVWGEQVKGTNRVTVNLGGARARVNIYDPTMAAAPAWTLSNAISVPLLLSDHPVIIELPADGSAPNRGRVPPHPG
ncbi:MAG: glycosyl hydrolase [Verrucomicrobiota bacterium]